MKPPPASRVWRALVVVLFWAYALLNTYFTFSPLLRSTPRLAFILVPLVMGGSSLSHAMYMLGLRHALAFFALAALISLAFEAAGVATGAVYGPYHYTDFLDPKLFDVPLLVPLSWFMIIYPGYALVNYLAYRALEARWPPCPWGAASPSFEWLPLIVYALLTSGYVTGYTLLGRPALALISSRWGRPVWPPCCEQPERSKRDHATSPANSTPGDHRARRRRGLRPAE